ncbi:Prophage minor tail protein Z (GPZ) [Escherichia coli]|nr:Prophage minor tail protein Z (GPZ) [Escherichia coli]
MNNGSQQKAADSLNLQTAQDTDNGYSVFEQSLLRYIAAGLGVSYEQLSRNYAQMSYSTARASANESWAYFMGRRKFVASRQASQMFLCWLEEAIVRRVVTLPSKARFSFQEARSACMAIKGLEQAVENLSRISKTAVPGAAAMAINRVASSAISQSASQVARETKVRRKLVKERARLKRATVKNPQARIKVNRGDLPVIKLGNARVVLSRRRRRKKGQRSSLKGGGSVLVVGNRADRQYAGGNRS